MSACSNTMLLFLALLSLPAAAGAQTAPPQPEVMDEVIVTAPRNGEPDFDEAQEYHQKEFQRLHARFGKPPPAQPRGDQAFGAGGTMDGPNDRSSAREQVQSAPRLRDTFGDK